MAATDMEVVRVVDPLRHPDLTRLGRRMRDQLDETLEAEQHAAHAVVRRRRSMRDLLLQAEDRRQVAVASGVDGQLYRGVVRAVGADHVVLATDGQEQVLAIAHIVGFEFH